MTSVHFTHNSIINPTNPVSVNIIGAGGTGSQVLTALARMNQSLLALGHPGLQVQVFDGDAVTKANLGRQLFSQAELGLNKGVVLMNRINRFFGTNWKAFPFEYSTKNAFCLPWQGAATITISCVDTIAARFDIAALLTELHSIKNEYLNKPLYWLDFGNSRYTGQAVLSTVGSIKQPASKKYAPVANLPFITDTYAELLQSDNDKNTPSCSLAEALQKQDLYINSTLANMGASLLWQLFREGMIFNKGFFLNLKDFRTLPIAV